jgi:hypothetical protein
LNRGELPAFSGVSPEEITRDWPAGVLEPSDLDGALDRLAAYHPWHHANTQA